MNDAEPAGRRIRDILQIETLDRDLYRAAADPRYPGHIFGGKVIGQALAAASATIEGARHPHSLHAYFLRAGENALPIVYRVARDLDGGSFSNRRVVALQDGKPLLNLAASFQDEEDGMEHGAPLPDVPAPEQCLPIEQIFERRKVKFGSVTSAIAAFDMRVVMPPVARDPATGLARQHAWFRLPESFAGLDSAQTRTCLAFLSDFGLVATALVPHGRAIGEADLLVASLDHAMWIHRTPPVGEWLLYSMDSPWGGNGRGLGRGMIFDSEGRMVATTTQEGLIRQRRTER